MGLFWWTPFGRVPEVTPPELESMRIDPAVQPQILDVRTGTEWRAGHIPGAVHVPITEFEARLAGLQLDGGRPVVAICRSAHRSIPAVRLLRRHGFASASQLRGGMLAWWKAGLPCEADEPASR